MEIETGENVFSSFSQKKNHGESKNCKRRLCKSMALEMVSSPELQRMELFKPHSS